MIPTVVVALATVTFIVFKWFLNTPRSRLPFPPGPKPLPIIGNILDVPTNKPWETYQKWFTEYSSDIIFLHTPMQPIVILNTVKANLDLLEKRSHLYSGRIQTVMAELVSWGWSLALMDYGPRWRAHRRTFHQYFNQNAVNEYRPYQLQEVRAFLGWILDSPHGARQSIRQVSTSIIFRVVYGRKISGLEDEYVRLAREAVEGFDEVMVPGRYWIEYIPFLKHVPSWVPWNRARQAQKKYRQVTEDMINRPFNLVKEEMAQGKTSPSLTQFVIERNLDRATNLTPAEFEELDEIGRNVAGVAYAAGTDTTTTALEFFVLAMALNPHVQKKAQDELDKVVGPNRLPDHDDIESLVYIQAIVMEVARWIPVAPIGVPHQLTEDDTYNGYFLPKGAVVIPNAWFMLHDPNEYPEPDRFHPDRFIGPDGGINPKVLDPNTIAFGFGRRICPGRHLANNTLKIAVASILHVFDISPGMDESGNPIKLSAETEFKFFNVAVGFPHGFKPRSKQAEHLIRGRQ